MVQVDVDLRENLLGAGGKMGDQELQELDGLTEGATRPWPHAVSADVLVSTLFDSLVESAEVEQRRVDSLQVPDTAAKRNRRETYLNPRRKEEWQDRARNFLERRSDVASSLSTQALYSTVAMQHFIDLDIADLHLPPERRCSEDTYEDGVNRQFLLDAPRCRYTVDDEVFHLASKRNEERPFFSARLVDAVQRVTPRSLLSHVTTVMSQSGLAALERASLCQAAVSGGSQKVEYELTPQQDKDQPTGVSVSLQVRRQGFCEYLLTASGDPTPADSDSSLRKAATVIFGIDGIVDVVDFVEEIDIRQEGERVSAESLGVALPKARAAPSRSGWQHLLTALGTAAARCASCCRRRLREVSASREDAREWRAVD